jgi:hypothetical protein
MVDEIKQRVSRRVYRYGCLPPTDNLEVVRAQLRVAHDYRNDLIAIERGRRWALRQVDSTPDVDEAVAIVRVSTKNSRKEAIVNLRNARHGAREAASEELARIKSLDETIRRDARALTSCYWGSYLGIEAAHQQARQAPLYGDDGITPSDPHFIRWRGEREVNSHVGLLPGSGEGQIGVQLQKGLATRDALACTDMRVRLEILPLPPGASRRMQRRRHAILSIRVGSDGRDPVWARVPLLYHRAIPDAAQWKWVRVSLRHEGRHERWSCEITVDDRSTPARDLDRDLEGAVAVEWEWSPREDGSIRVARWADSFGQTGEEVVPARIAVGIRKTDGHRAVRDIVANEMRPSLQRMILDTCRTLDKLAPRWLMEAAATLHLWKSLGRLHSLHRRWHAEASTIAPAALAKLDEWVRRDRHLWDYESGMRGQTLAQRRDHYRCIARRWASRYRIALLSDQDLSREARFGAESEVRFTAGVSEFRSALRDTFGFDAYDARWKRPKEDDSTSWCEQARDMWVAEGAREGGMFAKRKEATTNAWAMRRAKSAEKKAATAGSREPVANAV